MRYITTRIGHARICKHFNFQWSETLTKSYVYVCLRFHKHKTIFLPHSSPFNALMKLSTNFNPTSFCFCLSVIIHIEDFAFINLLLDFLIFLPNVYFVFLTNYWFSISYIWIFLFFISYIRSLCQENYIRDAAC